MVKYKQAVTEMVTRNQALFDKFRTVHDRFAADQKTAKAEFDEVGRQVVRIVEEAENRLCSRMEGSGRGNYAGNLAEKFREEVRKVFPLIDFVGVTVSG